MNKCVTGLINKRAAQGQPTPATEKTAGIQQQH